ncbi:formate dehydrogenase subunit gamma [Desulfobacca acetoxidans]
MSLDSSRARLQRFDRYFRLQHILMFVSVIILVITAIPLWCLRYPFAVFPAGVIDFFGVPELVRTVHIGAGFLLLFAFGYQVFYMLVHPGGRRDFLLMLPVKKDFSDLYQNILYFLGKTDSPPAFGRFAYFQKFDYWAMFWGCWIMIGTGLIMLYPEKVTVWLPSGAATAVFGIAREAHYHDAILAALTLITWHMYHVHLRPGKFPGSMVWWHGRITQKEQEQEHPLEKEELFSLSCKNSSQNNLRSNR